MSTLYVHIGQYKTGSTSIQGYLADHYDLLLEKSLYYPSNEGRAYCYMKQHSPLVTSIFHVLDNFLPSYKNDMSELPISEWLEDCASISADNVLLSSEGFYARGTITEGVKRFADIASSLFSDIRIIVYLRRHDDWYISLMQEHLKGGRNDLYEKDPLIAMEHKHYLITEQLRPWEEVFGRDKIIVRPFDRRKWVNNDLIFDFLSIFKIIPEDDTARYINNTSLSRQMMQILYLLNKNLVPLEALSAKSRLSSHELRSILVSMDCFEYEGVKGFLSSDKRRKILEYFSDDLHEINEKYGEIFDLEIGEYGEFPDLSFDEISVFIKRLLVEIREQRTTIHALNNRL